MRKFTYTITDEVGIHARPAGLLVKEAKSFNCNITIECNGKLAELKKLFSVMGLGVKKDNLVEIICDGSDEDDAAAALEKFISEHF